MPRRTRTACADEAARMYSSDAHVAAWAMDTATGAAYATPQRGTGLGDIPDSTRRRLSALMLDNGDDGGGSRARRRRRDSGSGGGGGGGSGGGCGSSGEEEGTGVRSQLGSVHRTIGSLQPNGYIDSRLEAQRYTQRRARRRARRAVESSAATAEAVSAAAAAAAAAAEATVATGSGADVSSAESVVSAEPWPVAAVGGTGAVGSDVGGDGGGGGSSSSGGGGPYMWRTPPRFVFVNSNVQLLAPGAHAHVAQPAPVVAPAVAGAATGAVVVAAAPVAAAGGGNELVEADGTQPRNVVVTQAMRDTVDDDGWSPTYSPDYIARLRQLGEPQPPEHCWGCCQAQLGEAAPRLRELRRFSEHFRKSYLGGNGVSVAKEMFEMFERTVREPANRTRRSTELEIPEWSAATILEHCEEHMPDPETKQKRYISAIGQMLTHHMRYEAYEVNAERDTGLPIMRVNPRTSQTFERNIRLMWQCQQKRPDKMNLGTASGSGLPALVRSGRPVIVPKPRRAYRSIY